MSRPGTLKGYLSSETAPHGWDASEEERRAAWERYYAEQERINAWARYYEQQQQPQQQVPPPPEQQPGSFLELFGVQAAASDGAVLGGGNGEAAPAAAAPSSQPEAPTNPENPAPGARKEEPPAKRRKGAAAAAAVMEVSAEAMCQAAGAGNLAEVQRQLGAGVDPNEEGADGKTALHVAAAAGKHTVVRELVAATPPPIPGASRLLGIDQKSKEGCARSASYHGLASCSPRADLSGR